MSKRVWILGAGFSQPLGGPLLRDLFRPETKRSCDATFPQTEYQSLAAQLFALQTAFIWGRDVAGHWEDAELFLAFIDDAFAGAEDNIKKDKLQEMLWEARRPNGAISPEMVPAVGAEYENRTGCRLTVEDLPRLARRTLVAQCQRFLFHRQPLNEEAWGPYVRWADSLAAEQDTVITFNYDRVLELLDPEGKRFQVLLPETTLDPSRIPVFKLHGSVDWILEQGAIKYQQDHCSALRDARTEFAIASPGAAKAGLVSRFLEGIWGMAMERIAGAQSVMILGYGFPKTDSNALSRILGALKTAGGFVGRVRDFHVILGPDVGTPNTQRVLALLQACTNGRYLIPVSASDPIPPGQSNTLVLKQHPLWTQDFMGDWPDRVSQVLTLRRS